MLYDIYYGEARLPERNLDHLEGYAGSRPMRVGTSSAGQLQLDTYSEVIDAVFEFARRGGRLDRSTGRMLVGLGETVCRRWQDPDEGTSGTRPRPVNLVKALISPEVRRSSSRAGSSTSGRSGLRDDAEKSSGSRSASAVALRPWVTPAT